MSVKISLEKTLRVGRELWIWMFREKKSRENDKYSWPGWKKYRLMELGCSSCEYVLRHNGKKIYHLYNNNNPRHKRCIVLCPLKELWPEGCCDGESPFNPFRENEGTPENSMEIIKGHEKVMKKNGFKVSPYRYRPNRRKTK